MSKDHFKTRLEIAKSKIFKKNSIKIKNPPSSIGAAFKLSTELVSAVASWDNYWVYFRQDLWY